LAVFKVSGECCVAAQTVIDRSCDESGGGEKLGTRASVLVATLPATTVEPQYGRSGATQSGARNEDIHQERFASSVAVLQISDYVVVRRRLILVLSREHGRHGCHTESQFTQEVHIGFSSESRF